MTLKPINDFAQFNAEKSVKVRAEKFTELWEELNEQELPIEVSSFVNSEVDHLNSLTDKNKVFKHLGKSQAAILKRVKEEMDLIPANYHRNMWLGLGIAVFGVPMGVVFGMMFENMAFIGLGIPIGLALGIGIGVSMDAKSKADGKQLRFEA